jgi:hypothetical protein
MLAKIFAVINIAGFFALLALYTVGLYVGSFLYTFVLTPILWVMWQFGRLLPEVKPDPNPHLSERAANAVAHGLTSFVDNHIFKRPELESERWTREWEARLANEEAKNAA